MVELDYMAADTCRQQPRVDSPSRHERTDSNVKPHEPLFAQRKRLDFHKSLDRHFLSQTGNHPQVEAAIRNHEVAYKMQAAVPNFAI